MNAFGYPPDEDNTPLDGNYIIFGDLAREKLGMQCQYASRYVDGRLGYKNLGDGLRFIGDPKDYHTLKIHQDDAKIFVERFNSVLFDGD